MEMCFPLLAKITKVFMLLDKCGGFVFVITLEL